MHRDTEYIPKKGNSTREWTSRSPERLETAGI